MINSLEHPATVSEIMSSPVLTVDETDSLWDAWQLLSVSGLRHLIVMDRQGDCMGAISDRNILAEIPITAEHLGARRVSSIMNGVELVFIYPHDSPVIAAALMREHELEALPVCNGEGRILGIVTERDLVRWIA